MIFRKRHKPAVIDEHTCKTWFEGCHDVKIEKQTIGKEETITLLLIYCTSLINTEELRKTILPHFSERLNPDFSGDPKEIQARIMYPITPISSENLQKTIVEKVFEGGLIIVFPNHLVYTLDISNLPKRSVETQITEVSVRGARDGFIEEIDTNIGLIRKRLKTDSLSCEEFVIGKRTKTRVGLLYLKDVVADDTINDVRARIREIKVDGVVSNTQIEELITDNQYSIFPLVEYTGRPDFATNCLLHGRFIILVEGSPTVTIGPVSLPFFVNNAEDQHTLFFTASFERLLRYLGFAIAILLPGFWIALLSFHPDQIPYTLLATVSLSRQGVPFPAPLEGLFMITVFELLREAGLRLPSAFGQTLSVVGGLIIGQAAISSGVTSPGTIVAIAISVVSTFILVNQSLTGTVSVLRYFVFLLSSTFGIIGFIGSIFIILTYVVNLRSFGLYYLTPYAPPVAGSIISATVRKRFKNLKKRPKELGLRDRTRKE
ncbi:spore germination protein [Hazenella coriacea]|uniref:GerA spore germination protein n=1 Tax=Hazenella coriacea TaxID=1179467 RepID=A0A4R3L603_9BACL|nr:spore germination protein [Hazenella coriacea]TCS93614.1 GerA spore germination protein [Hazenella coriacea]